MPFELDKVALPPEQKLAVPLVMFIAALGRGFTVIVTVFELAEAHVPLCTTALYCVV